MGLNVKSNSQRKEKVVIKHGGLCLESREPKPGYEKIPVFNPSTGKEQDKWIQKFSSLTGYITDISWYDTEEQFETRFQGVDVTVVDSDGEETILDLPMGRKSLTDFCRRVENIDFSKEVEFRAFPDKEKSDRTVFFLKQDGKTVPSAYTKDGFLNEECPQAVQNKRTGKWDFSAQEDWLLGNLLDTVIPSIKGQLDKNAAAYQAVAGVGPAAKAAAATASPVHADVNMDERWADAEDPLHDDEE